MLPSFLAKSDLKGDKTVLLLGLFVYVTMWTGAVPGVFGQLDVNRLYNLKTLNGFVLFSADLQFFRPAI